VRRRAVPLSGALLTAVLLIGGFYFVRRGRVAGLAERARAALAQTSGAIRVPSLAGRVEVLRDRFGIPHIYADSEADLFTAQGFVQAQDRLFQMELWRRSSQGRLAELMGPRAVERDRLTRLVARYRGDLSQEWASYDPSTRPAVEHFVRGVNAWMEHLGGRRPLEFELLGIELERWSPEDLLSRAEAFTMSYNAVLEVQRAQVVRAGGTDLAVRLRPPDPPVPLLVAPGVDLQAADDALEQALALIGAPGRFDHAGSNNWAVAGRRSVTGHPLVANDPHRALDHPSLRYLVHLDCPTLHVAGAVVPWFPGIAVGHNERVAWGLTIFRADVQDLYEEMLDPEDHRRYRVGDDWERLREQRETIRVKDQPPAEVTLSFSRHGPVVRIDPARHVAWALRWTGDEPGTAGYLGGLGLGRARSAAELRGALARWKMPPENFVFADQSGEIGHQVAGLVPDRRGWSGLLPVPGSEGRYEWQGFLSPDELPHARDPEQGFVATANNNVLPPGYRHEVGHEWAESDRIRRIEQVLRDKETFSIEDFEALQHDVKTSWAGDLVPLLRAYDPRDPRMRAVRERILAWDGRLTRDSVPATVFAVWQQNLAARWISGQAERSGVQEAVVARGASLEAALRGLATLGSDRESVVIGALDDALRLLEQRLGPDMDAWRWGTVHLAWFEHPLARDDATRALFNRGPIVREGYANTVNATGGTLFRQTGGATFRAIFDLADWDRSVVTNAPGQSGQPGSLHFDDLLPYWSEGRYFPLAFGRAKVEALTEQRLVLEPVSP
jgi:penicillin G amidase